MINIFVGLSQNHIDLLQNLIKQLNISDNHNILITNHIYEYDSNAFDEILLSERGFNNNANNKLQELKNIILKTYNYKKIVTNLKNYKTEKNCTLYYSYVEDVLTNYLLFSFNKNIKGVVFEDGTLNYYNHTIKNIKPLKIALKQIIGFVIGVPFKKYKGHSSGINYDHVIAQYVRLPQKSICTEKSKQLDIELENIKELKNTVLIIGQEPYEKILGIEEYKKKLNHLLQAIKQHNNYNSFKYIYYKPHRHGKKIDKNLLLNIFGEKLLFINDNNTIENIFFNNLQCKYIYTFNSSAVLNIYLSLSEKLKNEIDINLLTDNKNKLLELYSGLNINILK